MSCAPVRRGIQNEWFTSLLEALEAAGSTGWPTGRCISLAVVSLEIVVLVLPPELTSHDGDVERVVRLLGRFEDRLIGRNGDPRKDRATG